MLVMLRLLCPWLLFWKVPAQESSTFSVLRSSKKGFRWAKDVSHEAIIAHSSALGIPRIIHRSHKYSITTVHKQHRLWSNLQSCARLNPTYESRYYDNSQVIAVLQALVNELDDDNLKAAFQRLSSEPLSQAFVLRSDWFRLAVLYLNRGWWLDGDVRCIDGIDDVLNSEQLSTPIRFALEKAGAPAASSGCIFAWENELPQPRSAPLNWAIGCVPMHPLLYHAMQELASRVLNLRLQSHHDPFFAQVATDAGLAYVDVLHITGPGMIGEAFTSYAGMQLNSLRERYGEDVNDSETWSAISAIAGVGDSASIPVVILPYCFFRSRGCSHLMARFEDRVIFHHEFDTSWRTSYWHNYINTEL